MTNLSTDLSSTFEKFKSAITAGRALTHFVSQAMWHETSFSKDEATGFGDLFDGVFARLDECEEELRASMRNGDRISKGQVGPLTADARRAARVANIQLIIRDTDYSLVAERYALPEETLRDILYAMIDAPQRVHSNRVNDEPAREVKPLKGIDEIVQEGFAEEVGDDIDAEQIAAQLKMRKEAVEKVIAKLKADNRIKPPERRTGTDD